MKKLFYLMVAIAVLGIIVSGCSIPLKSVVPTSEKENLNPELGTPTLEKITFIHYVKPNDRSKPVWDDTEDIYKFMVGGIKWVETMEYEVNTDVSGLTGVEVLDALGASLDTWNTAIDPSVNPSFVLFDPLVTTDKEFVSGEEEIDGVSVRKNRITFDDLTEDFGINVIAVCYMWFSPATKEIVETDVRFNTYFDWSVDDECSGNEMDLQSIATHEFGHNGLNDLYSSPSVALTMHGYTYVYCETHKRGLGTGDISGIQELYGVSN